MNPPDVSPPPSTDLAEENAQLRAELDRRYGDEAQRRQARRRGLVVGTLVVLASLGIALSTLVLWADRTLLTTDGWVATMAPVFQQPGVVTAVSHQAGGQLVEALDLQARAAEVLPERLRFMAVPLTAAIENFTTDLLADLLRRPEFQALWVDANRELHERALKLLHGEAPNATLYPDGTVKLNLFPLMDRALARLEDRLNGVLRRDVKLPDIDASAPPEEARRQLEAALGIDLRPGFGELELIQAAQLLRWQEWVLLFERLIILLPIVTAVLLVLGLWLSRARRRTLAQLAVVTAACFYGLRLLAQVALERAQAATPATAGGTLVDTALGMAAADLDGILRALAIVALVMAIGAYLAGRPAWLVAATAWLRRPTPATG